MNEYYEKNMPSGVKPMATSSASATKKFIKDKYVKQLWLDEDEDDPVYLFQSGKYEKRQKKKEKKEKRKKDKKERKKKKEEKRRREKERDQKKSQADFIDFEEDQDDGFGDFQEAAGEKVKAGDAGMGDLIGGSDDFGDFVTPSEGNVKKDDDFGDFISSGDTASGSAAFVTPPSASVPNAFGAPPAPTNDLTNNLSNLYNQSQPKASEPENKYAALENLGTGFGQPQQNMFTGMSVSQSNGFGDQFQQPVGGGFAPQTQSWANPGVNTQSTFSQNQFAPQSTFPAQTSFPPQTSFPQSTPPSDPFSDPFSAPTSFTPRMTSPGMDMSQAAPSSAAPLYSKPAAAASSTGKQSKDLFGLKATLQSANKMHKYNKPAGAGSGGYMASAPPKQSVGATNAFSGLVSTQWNA